MTESRPTLMDLAIARTVVYVRVAGMVAATTTTTARALAACRWPQVVRGEGRPSSGAMIEPGGPIPHTFSSRLRRMRARRVAVR